jgi:hypothetical protein
VAGSVAIASDAPRATEGVAIVGEGRDRRFACGGCGRLLGAASEGYRPGCRELDVAIETISPLFVDPVREAGESLVLRRTLCPGCGDLLDSYICRPADEPFTDVILPS